MSAAFLFSVLLIVAIVGAGFFGALREKRQAEAEPPPLVLEPAEPEDPFGDLPEERAPERARGPGFDPDSAYGESLKPEAPASLLRDERWTSALALSDQAVAAFRVALEAREDEDRAGWQESAGAALDLWASAYESTDGFAAVAEQRHGERDPLVKRILDQRQEWAQKIAMLRKTTSR